MSSIFIKAYRMASCSLNLLCHQLKLIKMQLVSRIVSFVCTNCCPFVRFIRLQARSWESSCYGGRQVQTCSKWQNMLKTGVHMQQTVKWSANTRIMQTLKDARTHKKDNATEKCSKKNKTEAITKNRSKNLQSTKQMQINAATTENMSKFCKYYIFNHKP